jgi:hypothetical protein
MALPDDIPGAGFGAFAQWQTYHRYARWAGGLQAGVPVGGELGFARVTESAHHAGTWGVHVGAYASVAFVGTALRLTAPLANDGGRELKGHPLELSWVLTVKIPISNVWQSPSGRPLRVDQEVRAAQAVRHSGWALALNGWGPLVAHLSSEERAILAREWLRDGLMEHASVASFAALTLQLLGLGAPSELVSDSQRAGQQEVEHAQLCCTLASCYAAEALGPGPLNTEGAASPIALDALAIQSWKDGCVGETLGAMVATRALRCVGDPTLKAVLSTIAGDEREHAELAWRIVHWCLAAAPNQVGPALYEVAAEETDAFGAAPEPLLLPTTLREHGRIPVREARLLSRRAHSAAVARLRRMLAEKSGSFIA